MRTLALLALLGGCATSTGGDLVPLTGEVVVAEGSDTFQAGDWTVTLDEATLAVGPVYLWSQRPNLDVGDWAGLVVTRPAWAVDPFDAGRIVGEIPRQVTVDLVEGGTVDLGSGTGVAGPVGSAEVWLEPREGGPTLRLRGTAARDDEVLPFAADITWQAPWVAEDQDRNAILLRRVRGLRVDATLDGPATVRVGVDPVAWLDAAALDALPDLPPDADGVRWLGPEDPVGRALDVGVRRIGERGPWTVEVVAGE